MAFANTAAYLAKMQNPEQRIALAKSFVGINATAITAPPLVSSWLSSGFPAAGAVPGAAATCNSSLLGSIGQVDAAVELRAAVQSIRAGIANSGSIGGITMILADRLCHMGGLSGIVTTPQTVSTPAVPRYTPATDQLFAAYEIYSAIGATQTTITASYTNNAGTAGQTSVAVPIGGTSAYNNVGICQPLSMAAGDNGFKSIETVTLAASTLTAGNFGITIYKPLLMIPLATNTDDDVTYDPLLRIGGLMPLVQPGACLWWLMRFSGLNTPIYQICGQMAFFED